MRFLRWLFGIALFSLLFAFSLFKISDPDVMQDLLNGKIMLSHGLYANFCFFNLIHHPCQIVYMHEWLFSLITYSVYRLGQWDGLVFFQAAIILAIFFTIALGAKLFHYSLFSTGIFLLFAMFIGIERFMLRAELFGLLMTVLFYVVFRYFVENRVYEKKKIQKYLFLGALFVIQVIWANTHGSFIIAFVIVGMYIFSLFLTICIQKYIYKKGVISYKAEFLALLLLACTTLIASVINPYGIQAFLHIFTFSLTYPALLSAYIQEWKSPFIPSNFQYFSIVSYKVLLVVSVITIVVIYKKMRFADIGIFLVFLYLSLHYERNIALFAMFCALILPYYFDKILLFLGRFFKKKHAMTIVPCTSMTLLTLLAVYVTYQVATNTFYIADQNTRRFGIGLSENFYPVGAANFIEKNMVQGNMFNDYILGEYLNFRFYPNRKTFIDGYTAAPSDLDFYYKIMSGTMNYNDIADQYGINYFIINHTSTETSSLLQSLYQDKKWVLVYFDEKSVIFVRNIPKNKVLINKYAITLQTNKNYDPNRLPTFIDPIDFPYGFISRGIFLHTIGLTNNANYEFQKAVALGTDDYLAYSGLGVTYAQLGQSDLAYRAFVKALALGPQYAPNHFNLGYYYLTKNMDNLALDEFTAALSINSTYPLANFFIGQIYEKQGNLQNAEVYFQNELDINPHSAPARSALQEVTNSPL